MNALSALRAWVAPEPEPNACRFSGHGGHVESYFLRANHPNRPLAVWLKQTLLAPLNGPTVAESWFVYFDGERSRTIAQRERQPWARARFAPGPDGTHEAHTAAFDLRLGGRGLARGALEAPEGRVCFDLCWVEPESPLARPLSIFPLRFLRTGPFPRAKALTPHPYLVFSGRLELPGESVLVDGWPGMQGHNWGTEHTFEYAWGQCLFPSDETMLEGFTGRVRMGGRVSPPLSMLVVQRRGRTYRFNRLRDLGRQRAEVGPEQWSLRLRSADGEATMVIDASSAPQVCLGYDNPDGEPSYCYNTKLARVELTVRPSDGASFSCQSEHGGALEFLRRSLDARFARVV